MNDSVGLLPVSTAKAQIWDKDDSKSTEQFHSFLETVNSFPISLSPSTYGEPVSFCLDIVALPHNAVRQELSDMYFMYRSMADLHDSLKLRDVKNSTLWFRPFCRFLIENVLKWHGEEYFPWFCSIVDLQPADRVPKMAALKCCHEEALAMSKELYKKQARLSAMFLKELKCEQIRIQFLDVVSNSCGLACQIVKYFRSVETFTAPLLYDRGVTKDDRDSIFRSFSKRVLTGGHAEIDLPMLVRWMQHSVMRSWLKSFAIDSMGRSIPLWVYNKWQSEYFIERHRSIVSNLVERAKRV